MLNNFIFARKKSLFTSELEKGNILDEAIVFIEDTKEIWNHGTYFDCSTVDLSDYHTKEEIATELTNYITSTDLSNAMSGVNGQINNLSSNLTDGLKASNQKAEDAQDLAQSVQNSLQSYVKTETLNQAISNVNSNLNSVQSNLNSGLSQVNEVATRADKNASDALTLAGGIQGSLGFFAQKTEIPTKVSDLENDVPYASYESCTQYIDTKADALLYKPCVIMTVTNKKVTFDASNPIQPGTIYSNSSEINSLQISSFAFAESKTYAEYVVHFHAGNECTLILPDYIYWSNGVIPLIEKSLYELNISATKQNNSWTYKAILVPFKQITE